MTVSSETITQTEPELSQPWRDVPGTALTDADVYDEEGLLLVAEENVATHRTWNLAELMTSYSVARSTASGGVRADNIVSDLVPRLTDNGSETGWMKQARCAGTDPEVFFPEPGAGGRMAQRVCAACTVRAECLEYAVTEKLDFGIWGGLSQRQFATYKRAIRRAEATAP